ncbi:hypothetical protein Slin15195_G126470 [Septoria linicola]|uniref:Uncharacterized protein n=1 Tax=Septoria linicola TaxID=215465 RepID=A0A9Q9ES81_9PEZI|nr:hypothetical protein Slin14017_G082650 [Septoria linicola]USW59328.1 hypothetical protein Slin15195_G126470 [Septoria linicola]
MGLISEHAIVRTRFVLSVEVVSLTLSLVAITLICFFIWERLKDTQVKHHSIASVTCLLSYASSLLFIVAVTSLTHLRLEPTHSVCDAIVVVCITLHSISKIAEFLFLIERLYIISWTSKPRHRSLQYILGCGLLILPYTAFTGATIYFRYANTFGTNICVIGIQFAAIMAIMSGEVAAQIYLTLRFLGPLFTVHRSIKGLVQPLRQMIRRTCIASAITLAFNIAASISIAIWQGTEPAYLCCLSCKANVLVASCMLYWMSRPIQSSSRTPSSGQQHLGIGFDGSALALPHDSSFVRPPLQSGREVDIKEMLAFYKYSPTVVTTTPMAEITEEWPAEVRQIQEA